MTFNPNEFLRLANELARNTDDEASLRSAVGRAYYAVFLQAGFAPKVVEFKLLTHRSLIL